MVFAFPLLTVLQRLDLTVDGIEIRSGEYLKLGPDGPTVPIDRYGRLAVPLKPVSPYAVISAEALIDGGDDLFPKQAPEPVVLRDDRSGAEPTTRAFSKMLPAMIAAIASDTGLADARDHMRIETEVGAHAAGDRRNRRRLGLRLERVSQKHRVSNNRRGLCRIAVHRVCIRGNLAAGTARAGGDSRCQRWCPPSLRCRHQRKKPRW